MRWKDLAALAVILAVFAVGFWLLVGVINRI